MSWDPWAAQLTGTCDFGGIVSVDGKAVWGKYAKGDTKFSLSSYETEINDLDGKKKVKVDEG